METLARSMQENSIQTPRGVPTHRAEPFTRPSIRRFIHSSIGLSINQFINQVMRSQLMHQFLSTTHPLFILPTRPSTPVPPQPQGASLGVTELVVQCHVYNLSQTMGTSHLRGLNHGSPFVNIYHLKPHVVTCR